MNFDALDELRERARLRIRTSPVTPPVSDPVQLCEELRLHQVELELQNEELRYAQVELARSRDRYRELYDGAPIGYLTLTLDGQVVSANATAARMFGVDTAELLDVHLQAMLDRQAADRLHLHLVSVIETGGAQVCELELRCPDGRRMWGRLESAPSSDPVATRARVRSMLSDVTERRRLEAQVEDRLATVGRLAHGVAHELNNLLMGMLGCVEGLHDELETEGRTGRLLGELDAAITRGSEFTRQLLMLGRPRDSVALACELDEFVAARASFMRATIGEQIELRVELEATNAWVEVDASELDQILVNLLVNARDALEGAHGTVVLRTETRELDEARAGNVGLQPGAYVGLSVVDTGVGMDADVRARLFEPFFTTKPVDRGSGLGLATVHSIVRRASGRIDVDSKPGEGTAVCVVLPRSAAPALAPALGAASIATRPAVIDPPTTALVGGREPKVLLVEDEAIVRMTLRERLELCGYRVVAAADGREALALLEAAAGREIDLLLTDVALPGLSGVELVTEATRLHPQLSVLYISAHPREVLNEIYGLPAEATTLQKPFASNQLITKLHELLERAAVRA